MFEDAGRRHWSHSLGFARSPVARYSIFRAALDRYDHIGVYIFFLVVGLPVVAVGLLLIAHYVVGPTS
jgi:hypothetical protein